VARRCWEHDGCVAIDFRRVTCSWAGVSGGRCETAIAREGVRPCVRRRGLRQLGAAYCVDQRRVLIEPDYACARDNDDHGRGVVDIGQRDYRGRQERALLDDIDRPRFHRDHCAGEAGADAHLLAHVRRVS